MFKKKQVVLAALVAMVGLAGYFNWSYQNSENGTVSDTEDMALGEARLVSGTNISEQREYFEESRMERDQGRSMAMESLKSIAENPESSEEAKKEAEMRIINMTEKIEKETMAEAEIKSKGYSDAVVFLNDEAVSVIVKKDKELEEIDAAKIQEIIIRITNADSSKINISRHK